MRKNQTYYEVLPGKTLATIHTELSAAKTRYIKDTGAFTRANSSYNYSYGWGFVFHCTNTCFYAILSDDDRDQLMYVGIKASTTTLIETAKVYEVTKVEK